MQATEVFPFDGLEEVMVDSDGNRMGTGRAAGRHLSDITKYLRQKRGLVAGAALQGDQPGFRMFVGFMWEWALELAFKTLMAMRGGVIKQPKLELDGIHMSPDALDTSNFNLIILEEYKLTWRSMGWLENVEVFGKKRPAPLEECLSTNFFDWIEVQIPGYLKGISEHLGRPVTTCRLYVAFVLGDYKARKGPRIRVFDIVYTPQELDRAWRMIRLAEADMTAEERKVA